MENKPSNQDEKSLNDNLKHFQDRLDAFETGIQKQSERIDAFEKRLYNDY